MVRKSKGFVREKNKIKENKWTDVFGLSEVSIEAMINRMTNIDSGLSTEIHPGLSSLVLSTVARAFATFF